MSGTWAAALAVCTLLAGCAAPSSNSPAPPPDRGTQLPVDPFEPSSVPLLGCVGVISRYAVPVANIRPFVPEPLVIYEGIDEQAAPGSGITLVSVSIYKCDAPANTNPGFRNVAIVFARVVPPPESGVTGALPYVARFYADEESATGLLPIAGVSSDVQKVFLDDLLGFGTDVSWVGVRARDTDESLYRTHGRAEPASATKTTSAGPFVALSANGTIGAWIVSNISVTSWAAVNPIESYGHPGTEFEAFTGSQAGEAKPVQVAVVDPLDFPITVHPFAWDGVSIPPPPR